MSFNHRIDLIARIDRLENLAAQTLHDIRKTQPDTDEYNTYKVRHKNCLYLIEMYKSRLQILEHHIEEYRQGNL